MYTESCIYTAQQWLSGEHSVSSRDIFQKAKETLLAQGKFI
jgi:hypothetical protein